MCAARRTRRHGGASRQPRFLLWCCTRALHPSHALRRGCISSGFVGWQTGCAPRVQPRRWPASGAESGFALGHLASSWLTPHPRAYAPESGVEEPLFCGTFSMLEGSMNIAERWSARRARQAQFLCLLLQGSRLCFLLRHHGGQIKFVICFVVLDAWHHLGDYLEQSILQNDNRTCCTERGGSGATPANGCLVVVRSLAQTSCPAAVHKGCGDLNCSLLRWRQATEGQV